MNRYLEYLAIRDAAARVRKSGEQTIKAANEMEATKLKELGITCCDREPGFPCFSHDDLAGYYSTPVDVLKALDRLKDKTIHFQI